jgi:hypothetical protein
MRCEVDHALNAVLETKVQAVTAERIAAMMSFNMSTPEGRWV